MEKGVKNLFFAIAVFVMLVTSVSAPGGVNSYTVKNSETTLNSPGFSSGNAYDFGFGDSVNLYSGNLIISATDVALSGRNGLGVSLTRQYDSSIFLHVNQCDTLGAEGQTGEGNYCFYNDLSSTNACTDCNVPSSVGDVYEGSCCGGDRLASSWERAKWLGRGWDMTYGRVKDPTSLFFDVANFYDFPKGIPMQGINTISVVLQNSENGVIFPSKFMLGDPHFYPFSWGTNLYAGRWLDILKTPTSHVPEGNPLSGAGPAIYTAYLSGSMSPLTLKYNADSSLINQGAATRNELEAASLVSNGVYYYFDHNVKFCRTYDDIPTGADGSCVNQRYYGTGQYLPQDNPYNWAENPYAGMYLTQVVDKAGNYIKIDYQPDAPYISTITDTLGRKILFNIGSLDINTLLGSIEYPNYRNDIFRVRYTYDATGTLLEGVHIDKRGSYGGGDYNWIGDILPPTRYSYDPKTQELDGIQYPNGVKVFYTYANEELFTFNLDEYTANDLQTSLGYLDVGGRLVKHRAVVSRRVYIPGETGNPRTCNGVDYTDNTYVWCYDYSTEGSGVNTLAVTTVTDPLGNRAVHKFLPGTSRSVHFNVGSGGCEGFDTSVSSDESCSYITSYVPAAGGGQGPASQSVSETCATNTVPGGGDPLC